MMQMIRLANALEQAAAQDNWLKVRELDNQIALLLSELREASLSDGDLQRLALLRKQHASVLRRCQQRVEMLRTRLENHQQQRAGIQAYSLFASEQE